MCEFDSRYPLQLKEEIMSKKYTSVGFYKNVSQKQKNARRRAYLLSGARIINQLKAFRKNKAVVVTIENPDKNQTNKRFIRVPGNQYFKPLFKESTPL
jgi:hypothetical protein